MQILLGIDDTDDSESRGTGHHARAIGAALEAQGLATFQAVTRHQLLISPEIAFTSRNSAACLALDGEQDSIDSISNSVDKELRQRVAASADPAFSIAPATHINVEAQNFGYAGKTKVLTIFEAREMARQSHIILNEVGGSGSGAIGALAAIGLHKSGDDGRFIWLPGLRGLAGRHTVSSLTDLLGVRITTVEGDHLPLSAEIELGEWIRPLLKQGRAILLAENEETNGRLAWRLLDKPTIKALSE
jgi:hypothetical protein